VYHTGKSIEMRQINKYALIIASEERFLLRIYVIHWFI